MVVCRETEDSDYEDDTKDIWDAGMSFLCVMYPQLIGFLYIFRRVNKIGQIVGGMKMCFR